MDFLWVILTTAEPNVNRVWGKDDGVPYCTKQEAEAGAAIMEAAIVVKIEARNDYVDNR